MPVLFLMRHGEAASALNDFARPLTPRGQAYVRMLGTRPAVAALRPDRLLCSPARRTKQTADILAKSAGFTARPDPVAEIYDATPGALYEIVKEKGGTCETMGLVGHNPGIHSLALWLAAGDGRPAQLHALRTAYAPGTMAILRFKGTWEELTPGGAALVDLIAPD